MSNFSFLAAAEQIICRTPPLAASVFSERDVPEGCSSNRFDTIMSNMSFLVAVEQIVCRVLPLAASEISIVKLVKLPLTAQN